MMVWFLVDDNLALHQKVNQAGNAAMGVWVRAGSWSAGNLTDGYVPSNVARQLGSQYQIKKLLDAGLWSRVTGGYQFHDWADCQPTAEQVKQRRADMRRRKAKQRKQPQPVTRDPHARGRPSPLKDLGSLPHQRGGPAPPAATAAPTETQHADTPNPAIDCATCDDDGYRPNGTVCDHVDRTETWKNGSAKARAAIQQSKIRKAAAG